MADDHAVAVEMMNRYSSQSSDNQRLMNYWTQPPTVVVEAASARSATSTAALGAAGADAVRAGAGTPTGGSPSGGGLDPSSAAAPAVVGFPNSTGAAPSAGRSGGTGTPAEIRPPNGERSGRSIGGSSRTGTRARRSVRGHTGRPARDGSRNRSRPWRSRRGAATKHDPGRSPPGRRGPVAGSSRKVAAVRSFRRRRRRPPRRPRATARPGGAADWRTGLRPAPATPLDTAEPPARAPRSPRSRRRRTAAPRRRSRRGRRHRADGRGTHGLRGPRDPADGRRRAAHGAGARAGRLPDRRHGRLRRRPLVPAAGDQRRCAGVAAGRLMCRSTDTARPSHPTHRTAVSGRLDRR